MSSEQVTQTFTKRKGYKCVHAMRKGDAWVCTQWVKEPVKRTTKKRKRKQS